MRRFRFRFTCDGGPVWTRHAIGRDVFEAWANVQATAKFCGGEHEIIAAEEVQA